MDGISVVIPNYNGSDLLAIILPTVYEALKNQLHPYEVIVSDDNSTDDSVAFLQNNFPSIKIITQSSNNGFSVTANLGISAARHNWILLLNSDVKLTQNYFHPLLKYTQQPNCFGVMGRIINWEDEELQDGAKYPRFHGMKLKTARNYLLKNTTANSGLPSIYLSGANMFFNKKVFNKIGGFNELFSPFYIEDYELSIRAWRLGYSCYYEHDAICRHKVSQSMKTKKKDFVNQVYNRNKMYLHAIHLNGLNLALWHFQLALEVVARAVLFQSYFLRAYKSFLNNLGKVRISKMELKEKAKEKKLFSIHEVVRNIKAFTSDKEIIQF